MIKRYTSSFLLLSLFLVLSSTVQAQNVRPEGTVYLMPQGGITGYYGDANGSLFNFDSFPWFAGAELGYQFSPSFALGLNGNYGVFPGVAEYDPLANLDDARSWAQLLARFTFGGGGARVAPFLQVGGFYAFQGHRSPDAAIPDVSSEDESAYGPSLGLGLDIAMSNQVSLLLTADGKFSFPDEGFDGMTDGAVFDKDRGSFDIFGTLGLGLKINFKSAFTPVLVTNVDGPAQLETNQEGTFTASYNMERASEPVTAVWDFGDGTTATGLTATHAYTQPGTYTASFAATNGNGQGSDSQSLTVTVVPPPVPAEIVTISATPTNPTTQDQVSFSANVRGDAPVSYNWNFGDGATATGATATHTYSEPGTYTATLEVSNQHGSDSRTTTVTVEQYLAQICREITEMNSVFFDRNSSTLTDQARATLQENVEILNECPNLTARVEGYAAPGERNAQQLSDDRARAVSEFYSNNGVAASRINGMGMGRVQGVTSKKEGSSQYRRVDTIPLR